MLKETGILNYQIKKVKTNEAPVVFDTEYHCVCVGFWCSRFFCTSRHDFILEMLGMVWIALGILQQKSTPHRSKGFNQTKCWRVLQCCVLTGCDLLFALTVVALELSLGSADVFFLAMCV